MSHANVAAFVRSCKAFRAVACVRTAVVVSRRTVPPLRSCVVVVAEQPIASLNASIMVENSKAVLALGEIAPEDALALAAATEAPDP
ncbi:hypothetical protein D3C85_1509460 [compost metagenome]